MFSTEWSGGSEPTGVQGSYVNTNLGFVGTLKEFRNLFRMHDIPTRIRRALEDARALEVEISKLLGVAGRWPKVA